MAKRTMRYGQVDPEEPHAPPPHAPPPHAPPPHAPQSHAPSPGPSWFETPFIVYGLCVVFFPVGLYGLWKNSYFSTKKKWVVTGLTLLLWSVLAGSGSGSGAGSESGGGGGDCSATYSQNGCTYFRDSNCNVIARDCE